MGGRQSGMKSERESGREGSWADTPGSRGRGPWGDWLILRSDDNGERNDRVLVRGRTLHL